MNTIAWARWKGGLTLASLNGSPGISTSQAQNNPCGASVAPPALSALIMFLTVVASVCSGRMPTVGQSAQSSLCRWPEGGTHQPGFGIALAGASWLLFQ